MKDIAIIGAGFSAATLSYFLKKDLDIFEKSRGVGGRCSTRRVDNIGLFDHGLQYIKSQDEQFKKFLKNYSVWRGNFKIFKNNIYIEVDGDFWHCNPETKHNEPIYECQFKNLEKDKIKDKWCYDNNIKLIRFWENDINNDLISVVNKIKEIFIL